LFYFKNFQFVLNKAVVSPPDIYGGCMEQHWLDTVLQSLIIYLMQTIILAKMQPRTLFVLQTCRVFTWLLHGASGITYRAAYTTALDLVHHFFRSGVLHSESKHPQCFAFDHLAIHA
jgi:hypothetical protein